MVKLSRAEKKEYGNNPIRMCSKECYFFKNGGTGCQFYKERQVKYGQQCLYDIDHLKRYSEAFELGKTDEIKKDAGQITAMIIMQIFRMLEQINLEGVAVDEPILDAKGMPVWIPKQDWVKTPEEPTRPMMVAMRKRDHPLLSRVIQMSRSIGLNLNDFKLTPKSADEKRQVSGHIIAENPETMKEVMQKREAVEKRFMEAIGEGDRLTKNDPVYQALLSSGEIVA